MSFKGNNGMLVYLTVFSGFFKLLLVKDLNLINDVNGRYCAFNCCFLQLTALDIQKSVRSTKNFRYHFVKLLTLQVLKVCS